MRCSVFCILVLAVGEPLVAYANRVVLVVPQQVRRSHAVPLRPAAPRYRKSSHGGDLHFRRYHGPYGSKKPLFPNPPFPHGGDDFDQGHENVNHVQIPYGKEISHAVSYGKGYIPYDRIKDSLSLGRERYPESQEHKQPEPEYASTSYTSTGPEFFPDPDSALSYDERRNDLQSLQKLYSSRSIEKDLTANIDLGGSLDQGKGKGQGQGQLLLLQQKAAELYRNVSPQPQGDVILPSGIPAATIGGSKEGIVLRDTVSLDHYQQNLREMTKSWPQFLATGATTGFQNQQVSQPVSNFAASVSWPLSFAQPKQGYAVKEDTMEPPHDFRNMPIQTNSFQAFALPVNTVNTMNAALPSFAQTVHG
ncbi:uncharacterized protein LOC143373672 [Andrena cerasifolii]|uniref:uncharacterized protein LOC143373672 n=1 Tax=Andrena cerasifolii TaxID=2819439 RepID=UPI0040380D49